MSKRMTAIESPASRVLTGARAVLTSLAYHTVWRGLALVPITAIIALVVPSFGHVPLLLGGVSVAVAATPHPDPFGVPPRKAMLWVTVFLSAGVLCAGLATLVTGDVAAGELVAIAWPLVEPNALRVRERVRTAVASR